MAIQYLGTTISGVAADAKPTLSSNENGVVFIETDTNKMFQWDGGNDTWNEVVASAATTSTRGTASFSSDNFAASAGVITIKDDGVILGTETTGDYIATIVGTDDEITVTGSGTESRAVTVGLPANVTISGNLTVSGDTTTVDTSTLAVEDPLISLATGNNTSDAVDIGIYGLYDTSGSQDLYGGFFRDASDGKWRLFKDNQAAPTTTVNTSGTGYAVGTLVANLEGEASTVSNGVYLSGDQTIGGNKTFSSTIAGDISGTAPAGTLTGTTLASTVTASSLTSVGNLTDLTVTGTSTTIGTVTSGIWQGDVIASAYLDSDTAHLSGTQTFTGAKTFSTGASINVANEDLALLTFEADMGTNNNRTLIISTPATDSASEPFRISTGNSLAFEIDGTERIELDSSGNTNFAGGVTFNSYNNAATRDNVAFKSQRTTGNATYLRIGRYGTGDDGMMQIANNYNRNSGFAADNTSVGVSAIQFETDGSLDFQTAAVGSAQPTSKMIIDHNGNVGIGTSNPDNKLHISDADDVYIKLTDESGGDSFFVGVDNTGLVFSEDSIGTYRMVINEGGSVGIGLANPTGFHDNYDNLVVGTGTGHNGITIYSQNNSQGGLIFHDAIDTNLSGFVTYDHNVDYMYFGTGGLGRISIFGGISPTLRLGIGQAYDTKILFDGENDDWYMGYDQTNGTFSQFAMGYGTTMGTNPYIRLVGSGDFAYGMILGGTTTSSGAGTDATGVVFFPHITSHSGDSDSVSLVRIGGQLAGQSMTTGGNTAVATSLHLSEPNITTSHTIDASASLYILNAATEATNNYALWVDDGATRFDGNVGIGTLAPAGQQLVIQGGSDPTIFIRQTSANNADSGKIAFGEADNNEQAWMKYDGSANQLKIETIETANAFVMDRTTGKITLAGALKLSGAGTPAEGSVLTSDADGDATWQAASGGGGTGTAIAMALVFGSTYS